MNFINRLLCLVTGYHIEPKNYGRFFTREVCTYCHRDYDDRCTGWPKK